MECGSTTNTAARRERVAFTIPHFIASSRLMVLASQPAERIEELNHRTVASTAGTTNIQSLAQARELGKAVRQRVPLRAEHGDTDEVISHRRHVGLTLGAPVDLDVVSPGTYAVVLAQSVSAQRVRVCPAPGGVVALEADRPPRR